MCYFSAKLRTVESVQKCRFAILRLLLLHRADLCFASKKKGSMEGGEGGIQSSAIGARLQIDKDTKVPKEGKGGECTLFLLRNRRDLMYYSPPFLNLSILG